MTNTKPKIKILKPSEPSQPTQSAALVGSNDDLLTEILLRLPATSILRFKSVSKHWLWLLSDKSFTLRFDKLSKSPGIFVRNKYVPFDVEDRSPPPFRSLDFYHAHRGIKILQSCNGLLLCCKHTCGAMRVCGGECERDDCNYYVFNPTTEQFAIIPPVPGERAVCKTICSIVLAFHQTHCVHYKLVCVRRLDIHRELCQIQVYSSDTGKWKISIESFSPQTSVWGIGVYWNGAIHWARNPLYYKVDVEELHSMPLLVSVKTGQTIYFGESRGHLHSVIIKYDKLELLQLNVYEMLGDHSGWLFKYQVDLDELPGAFPEMIPRSAVSLYRFGYSYRVVDMVRGEKDKDTFLVLLIHYKLIKYNINDKSFKLISILPYKDYYVSSSFHRYTEALEAKASSFLGDI